MGVEDRQYLQVRVREYRTEARRRRKGDEREWNGWTGQKWICWKGWGGECEEECHLLIVSEAEGKESNLLLEALSLFILPDYVVWDSERQGECLVGCQWCGSPLFSIFPVPVPFPFPSHPFPFASSRFSRRNLPPLGNKENRRVVCVLKDASAFDSESWICLRQGGKKARHRGKQFRYSLHWRQTDELMHEEWNDRRLVRATTNGMSRCRKFEG